MKAIMNKLYFPIQVIFYILMQFTIYSHYSQFKFQI